MQRLSFAPKVRKNSLKAVDLFCGAGGITLGLLQAGFDVRFCADISAACGSTHERNFPVLPFHQLDVSKIDGSDVLRLARVRAGELDLLIGGPPCQGFSIIGQRAIDDPRNGLLGRFLKIAFAVKPKAIVIENVPGLATLGGGAVLEEIGNAFDAGGYDVHCAELLAAQYGVPQMRWRVFFVAWRRSLGLLGGGFPSPTHGRTSIGDLVPNRTLSKSEMEGFITIGEAIGDLPPVGSGEINGLYSGHPSSQYQRTMRVGLRTELHNHYAPRMSEANLARIRYLKPGQDWRDLPIELLPPSMRRALRKDHTRRYRRMSWDGVARSIITRFRDPKSGEYIHPDQTRTISIREAARIQSFPDWFEFMGNYSDQYDQVGNAVPPLLANAVAAEIAAVLSGATRNVVPVKSRYRIVA